MSTEFLGSGWRFPVDVGDDGAVTRAQDEDGVADAIWLILSTAPGERVMRPDFGCGIHDLVFAVPDTATAGLLVARVREALTRWEPRIDLLGVDVDTDPDFPTTLLLGITYRVRTTNTVFNLVFPFYLEDRAAAVAERTAEELS